MKCRACGEKAVVNMREHKLALCKTHFLEWIPGQVQRCIEKYGMFTPADRILVAVSGGKDSLSLWHILQRLGYKADGLYIAQGIDAGTGYSAASQSYVEHFAQAHELSLHIVDIPREYGASIPQFAKKTERGRGKTCSVCGLIKRHEMNRIARESSYGVLATGHNLDDETAVLFGNTLNWAGEYLLRQGPVLEEEQGLARKVKPLCRLQEREMLAYALLSEIKYIYDECPYATGSTSIFHKQLLNKLENERPGAKLSFYLQFLDARKKGLFASRDEIREGLHPCPQCTQPTSAPGPCSFCRTVGRA